LIGGGSALFSCATTSDAVTKLIPQSPGGGGLNKTRQHRYFALWASAQQSTGTVVARQDRS
jgi:hypothetical protein